MDHEEIRHCTAGRLHRGHPGDAHIRPDGSLGTVGEQPEPELSACDLIAYASRLRTLAVDLQELAREVERQATASPELEPFAHERSWDHRRGEWTYGDIIDREA